MTEQPIDASGATDEQGGREYLVSMIESLAVLARRLRQDDLAILLEAILASGRARDRRNLPN